MTRGKYVEELEELLNSVRLMGIKLEETLAEVVQNLEDKNPSLAQAIMAADDDFDNMEVDIEKRCLSILLRQTPVASDLREIASSLKLVGDLERIADHCSDISQYTLDLCKKEPVDMPADFMKMLRVMEGMVADSINAVSETDLALAKAVIAKDDVVDDHFRNMRHELTELMQKNPQNVPQYVDYLMISKYVERVADHATNIAEWVVYIVTNEIK